MNTAKFNPKYLPGPITLITFLSLSEVVQEIGKRRLISLRIQAPRLGFCFLECKNKVTSGITSTPCPADSFQSKANSRHISVSQLAVVPIPFGPFYHTSLCYVPFCNFLYLLPAPSRGFYFLLLCFATPLRGHVKQAIGHDTLLVKGKWNYVLESWLGFIVLNYFYLLFKLSTLSGSIKFLHLFWISLLF